MTSKSSATDSAFPTADMKQKAVTAGLLKSKLWWVTAACVLMALILTWQSLPESGPTITIQVPKGHNLEAGDVLRHRGIDVGVVESVSRTPELDVIQTRVVLQPKAETLCRVDSRFWIVRPL